MVLCLARGHCSGILTYRFSIGDGWSREDSCGAGTPFNKLKASFERQILGCCQQAGRSARSAQIHALLDRMVLVLLHCHIRHPHLRILPVPLGRDAVEG
jgi:hypothetical protein